jgi:hypothetical protein
MQIKSNTSGAFHNLKTDIRKALALTRAFKLYSGKANKTIASIVAKG